MKKTIMKGACLARSLETQASDSTGFRYSLKQFVEYLDESKTAYDRIDIFCQDCNMATSWLYPRKCDRR